MLRRYGRLLVALYALRDSGAVSMRSSASRDRPRLAMCRRNTDTSRMAAIRGNDDT